jgi:hypothetical protein
MADSTENKTNTSASPLRRFAPHVIAVLALLSLFVVSTLLWLEMKSRFPVLEPGAYFGTISGILEKEHESLHFYVERPPQGDDLFFCILRPGWKPQMVSAMVRSGSPESNWLLPVTVINDEAKLKFIGARAGPGEYTGNVSDAQHKTEGTWTLNRIDNLSSAAATDSDAEDLKLWLRARADLADIDRAIAEAEQKVPEQKADIEKLQEFISERGKAQASSDAKYKTAQDELALTKAIFVERREKLQKLQERIEISQRSSAGGKLVMLARESLERDARWAESMLRTSGTETVAGLDLAVEQGQKILALKREIELEKNTMFRLRFGDDGRGNTIPGPSIPPAPPGLEARP